MMATIGTAEAALRSWHAFRVTIACALLANAARRGMAATEAITELLVRWKSVESVRCYAKMLPAEYADLVDEVTRTDA